MYRTFEELPVALSPMDIAKVLGLSKNNAYALCNSENFPSMRIGKKIIVNKERFICWFNQTQAVDLKSKTCVIC